MSEQQAPEAGAATQAETELWHTLRHGWVLHLEGVGPHRLVLLPGDAARLATLLREAQPPAPGTSAAVRAYLAAHTDAAGGSPRPAGRIDRLRTALAQWVYDAVAP